MLDIRWRPSKGKRTRKREKTELFHFLPLLFLAMWERLKGVLSSLRTPKQSYSIQVQDIHGEAPAGSTTDRSAGDGDANQGFNAWKAQWAGTIVVLVGVFSIWLNFSVLSVALPTLAKYFDTPEQNVAWVRIDNLSQIVANFLIGEHSANARK